MSAGEAALIPQVMAFSDEDLDLYDKKGDRAHELARRQRNLERDPRGLSARYPNDPFALYFLAESEFALGNYAAIRSGGRPASEHPPERRSRPRSKGDRDGASSRAICPPGRRRRVLEQARAMAAKANHLDPADPLPLLAYYETFHAAGETGAGAGRRGTRCRSFRRTRAIRIPASCWSTNSPRSANGPRRSPGWGRSPTTRTIRRCGIRHAQKMARLKAMLAGSKPYGAGGELAAMAARSRRRRTHHGCISSPLRIASHSSHRPKRSRRRSRSAKPRAQSRCR